MNNEIVVLLDGQAHKVKMPLRREKPKNFPTLEPVEKKQLMAEWHEMNTCLHCDTSGAVYQEHPTEFHRRLPPEYRVEFVTVYAGELACHYCFRLQSKEGAYA